MSSNAKYEFSQVNQCVSQRTYVQVGNVAVVKSAWVHSNIDQFKMHSVQVVSLAFTYANGGG